MTISTQSLTFKDALNSLLKYYPKGLRTTYNGWGSSKDTAKNLTLQEVQILSADKETFKQLVLNDSLAKECLLSYSNYLIETLWYSRLAKSAQIKSSKIKKAEQQKVKKERKQLENRKHKLALRQQRKKETENRKRINAIKKNKAKQKVALWKELNLSPEQKCILRKLSL